MHWYEALAFHCHLIKGYANKELLDLTAAPLFIFHMASRDDTPKLLVSHGIMHLFGLADYGWTERMKNASHPFQNVW